MTKHEGKTWVCPLCIEGEHEYGKNECEGVAVCGNTPNANAHQYLDSDGYKTLIDVDKVRGVGIGEISNE